VADIYIYCTMARILSWLMCEIGGAIYIVHFFCNVDKYINASRACFNDGTIYIVFYSIDIQMDGGRMHNGHGGFVLSVIKG